MPFCLDHNSIVTHWLENVIVEKNSVLIVDARALDKAVQQAVLPTNNVNFFLHSRHEREDDDSKVKYGIQRIISADKGHRICVLTETQKSDIENVLSIESRHPKTSVIPHHIDLNTNKISEEYDDRLISI